MDAHEYGLIVQETMEAVRDSLVVIEEAAQREEQPTHHALARIYAGLVPLMREYLSGLERGRPLPRQLARRVLEAVDELAPLRDLVAGLGLHPDSEELRQLALLAADVQGV